MSLLGRGDLEEKNYNWKAAAKHYEQAVKAFLAANDIEKAALSSKKLGYVNIKAAKAAQTAEEFIFLYKQSIDAFREAVGRFKQFERLSAALECEAEISYSKGFIVDSLFEAKEAFDKAYELFIKSSNLYSNENDQEGMKRSLNRAGIASFYRSTYCSEEKQIREVCHQGLTATAKSWELASKFDHLSSLVDSLLADYMLLFQAEMTIVSISHDENWRERVRKFMVKLDETLGEDHSDHIISGKLFLIAGSSYGLFGAYFLEDKDEQAKYFNAMLGFFEKAFISIRKTGDKILLTSALVFLNRESFLSGKLQYITSRLLNDLNEVAELRKVFIKSFSYINFIPTLNLMANYGYMAQTNYSQIDSLDDQVLRDYSEKAVTFAEHCLKIFPLLPVSVNIYQSLTFAYSRLTRIAQTKLEQENYIQKILHSAKQVEKLSEKYVDSLYRPTFYSTLFESYLTLADFSENREERIRLLSDAAAAGEKSVSHEVGVQMTALYSQMRLGYVYNELNAMVGDRDTLTRAKEIFLNIIKLGKERMILAFVAAAHEYLASIEDRLGNHSLSAKHYENIQKIYSSLMEQIAQESDRKSKSLITNLQEKIDYARAWNFIERGKIAHKRENHLETVAPFEKGSRILEKLPSYSYEAPFYISRSLYEEAEHFSKLEMHEDAKKSFTDAKKSFNNASVVLEKAADQATSSDERERIQKLGEVAKARTKYCSARAQIEIARIHGKQGEYYEAAEIFGEAASCFKHIATLPGNNPAQTDFDAIYHLCKAWENMELAEHHEDPDRFTEAAQLFASASKLFVYTKMKQLVLGNSAYCLAMAQSCKFDEAEIAEKAQLYPQIKIKLRKASALYQKGGFEGGASWAMATSIYFDAVWYLIKSDEELELEEKQKLLGVGSEYLNSAAELFTKAGHEGKAKEIHERLSMVEQEEKILLSALGTMRGSTISRSTLGIITPNNPIETSQPSRIEELAQFSEEVPRLRKRYELIYKDLLEDPEKMKGEFRVGIAQIGLSEAGDILSEFYEEKIEGLFGFRESKVEFVRSKVKQMIEDASSKGIHILVFPELTIDLNYNELLEEIKDLSKTHNMYVIPGSFHDLKSKKNISVVISPDGILSQQEKHIPATIAYEGIRVTEGINSGIYPRKTVICNTEYGRMAITICRDFLDMDLRVELKNFEPPVDLIFNPAFTPVTADFKAAHFDARRSIYAYCFFANVAEFGDSLIFSPEKDRTERTVRPKEEGLIYKDVDLFRLCSERKKWELRQKKFVQSTRTG
ncbi:MAG: carbon-nitrogen hydrolase family protein [Candidatus Hodarchaeales archaeon]|jgi:predicted amidohydrolase/tetratricopeptide (TPR) repeat protein